MSGDRSPLFERAFAALGWRTASTVSTMVVQSSVVVLLARLLAPEAFGLIAQGMIFIGFVRILSEGGMAGSIVQRQDLTEGHLRTAFTLAVSGGALVSFGVWQGAGFLASIFGEEKLAPLLRVMAVDFFFTNAGSTRSGLLQRQMDFRKKYWVSFTAYVVGYVTVGVSLAFLGFGAWALAYASLAEAFLTMTLLFIFTKYPWKPGFSMREAKDLLGVGTGMTMNKVVGYSTRQTDFFVIGRWMGAADLGLYSRGASLVKGAVTVSTILVDVLFPAYAEIQHNPKRLRTAFMRCVSVAALIAYPLLAGMFVAAPELIRGAFGATWEPAITILQIECVCAMFSCINSITEVVVRAKGAVYTLSFRRIVFALALLAGAICGTRWGINGVAIGVGCAIVVWYLLLSHLALNLIGGTWEELGAAQRPGLILAALVAGAAYVTAGILRIQNYPDLVILAATIVSCGLAVVAAAILIPKSKLSDGPLWARQKMEVLLAQRFGG